MVVGWSLLERMAIDIVVITLSMAKARGHVAEWAHDNDARLSCSHTGNYHDNAVAESFFATLKNEMHYRTSFATRVLAKYAVLDFIERCYGRCRPHSTIDCQVPARMMEVFFERTAPKPWGAAVGGIESQPSAPFLLRQTPFGPALGQGFSNSTARVWLSSREKQSVRFSLQIDLA